MSDPQAAGDGHLQIDTQLIHAGLPEPRIGGSASVPIFQSAVYEYGGGGSYHDIPYPRLSNLPNHRELGQKLMALEGGEAAFVTASGMAAISTALLTVAESGGHVLVQDCLYGGTHALFQTDLPALGISHSVIDARAPHTWASAVRPNTRAIYVEALTNPLVQVIDHRAVVEFARAHGLVAMIDSTFATPVNFRPLALGYDVCLHSATKYLNGHSDLIAGAVVGSARWVEPMKHRLDHLGGTLDALGCFLLSRGMRTLALRVRQQNESALQLARFLEGRSEIKSVSYPGLESHPDHAIARELFAGHGGVLAFEVREGQAAALALIDRLRLPVHGPSLGGVETLICLPSRVTHAAMSPAERARIGISDELVRLSVGIEAVDDLIADLRQGLQEA